MRKLVLTLGVALLGFLSFAATASAAGAVVPEDGSLLDLARPIVDAAMAGHYLAALAFALVLSVAAFKRYAPGKLGEFARTDFGGALTTFTMSFATAIGLATAAYKGFEGWSFGLLKTASIVGFLAIGGYVGVKRLLVPVLKKLALKAPAWTQPFFTIFFFVFDKPDPITDAEKAGAAAVAAKPATGTDGATSTTTTDI